jgi:hypothetical protein
MQGRLRIYGVIVEIRSWQLRELTKSCARAAVTKGPEAEESPLSEAVARECMVKTQQAGKG